MERNEIEHMGVDMGKEAVKLAMEHAHFAVDALARGCTHVAVAFVHMAHQEQLRAARITSAVLEKDSHAYPADYLRAIQAAGRPSPVASKAAVEGLGKLAELVAFHAQDARRTDPGREVDWAAAVERIGPESERLCEESRRPTWNPQIVAGRSAFRRAAGVSVAPVDMERIVLSFRHGEPT